MLVGLPILVALGVPPIVANATSYTVTLPGQLAAAYGYRRYIHQIPKRYALLLIPVILGAAMGAFMLRHTAAKDFASLIPLLVLLGVLLFTIQPVLHARLHSHLKEQPRTWLSLAAIGAAIVPITFYGGYFGAGYGFIMLAFLGLTNLPGVHLMNSMKGISAIFVAATSIACLSGAHLIDWHSGLTMAIGAIAGGFFGAHSAQRVSGHWLRTTIIVLGMAAAISLGVRQY